MKLPTDWGSHLPIQYYRVSNTPSPYLVRDCVGCNSVSEGDTSGTTFTTTDPNKWLCRKCESAQ